MAPVSGTLSDIISTIEALDCRGSQTPEIVDDRVIWRVTRGSFAARVTVRLVLGKIVVDTQIEAKAPLDGLGSFKRELVQIEQSLERIKPRPVLSCPAPL